MVQPAMEFKPKNQPCKKVSVYCGQMLPQKPPATQDLQQTYAQAQLPMHAKHEIHYRIAQQKHPLKCHATTHSPLNHVQDATAGKRMNAL